MDPFVVIEPTGSMSLPSDRATSKNRLARAERLLNTSWASALNSSTSCHFVVLTFRLPFIKILKVDHDLFPSESGQNRRTVVTW
jgi:hypothetical protein